MILYYCAQIKENGIWHNDPTYSPIAVEQKQAHLLIEMVELDDDARLIRVEKSEAVKNNLGEILWIRLQHNQYKGIILPVDVEILSTLIFDNIKFLPFHKGK